MRILVMPDYRQGNPYQQLLADSIEKTGTQVVFPQGYRRILPIFRAVQDQQPAVDVLHLHWLEPYLIGNNLFLKLIYALKFLVDIGLTRMTGTRLVWTIHNQMEHDNAYPVLEHWVRTALLKIADRIIVHNQSALAALSQEYRLDLRKVDIIPHGHYRNTYGEPMDQTQARKQLNLPLEGPIYLHLGALRPYKGIEHLLEVWQANQSHLTEASLLIAGCTYDPAYLQKLQTLITQTDRAIFYPHFVEDEQIRLFLSAADFVVLPYTRILTSGSVILAMSFNKPVIAPRLGAIPEVLGAADWLLYEPTDAQGLHKAIQKSLECSSPELKELTTQACNSLDWKTIGEKTAWSFQHCFSGVSRFTHSPKPKIGH